MSLDATAFAPVPAFVGGVLIGLSAALLVLGAGRVAGIAGIVAGLLQGVLHAQWRPHALRWAFVAGLLAAPWVWQLFAPLPPMRAVAGPGLLVAAGLLVGVGVRLGNGCTSGHGVCGLARLSPRSLANVLTFMGCGVATVALLRAVGALGA